MERYLKPHTSFVRRERTTLSLMSLSAYAILVRNFGIHFLETNTQNSLKRVYFKTFRIA